MSDTSSSSAPNRRPRWERHLRSTQRFAFTTLTAPAVTDFQVHLAGPDLAGAKAEAAAKEVTVRSSVMAADTGARTDGDAIGHPIGAGATSQPPTDTPTRVSSATSISIDFSVPMDRDDVEGRFAISPKIEGSLRGSAAASSSPRPSACIRERATRSA